MRVPRVTVDMMAAVIVLAQKKNLEPAGKELGLTASAVHKRIQVLSRHIRPYKQSKARVLCPFCALASSFVPSSDWHHRAVPFDGTNLPLAITTITQRLIQRLRTSQLRA